MKLPGSVLPSRAAVPAWGWRVFARLLVAAGVAVSACLPAHADDDLPGRVGRIAEFAGELFLAPEERATEWEAVGLNYPVISGDNLWVSGAGRAEIDYGGGQFRLAGDTSLHVSRLDDRQLALFIAQGRIIVRVRVLDPGDATRVDTPNTQVTLTRPGLYRIDVAPDRQQTMVTVREGEALVALANGAQQLLPGQAASVFGPNPAYADVRNNMGTDGFDAWSASRDRHYDQAGSSAFVSRQMVGYADLDAWGTWQTYPEYGAVWFPTTVAPGWAPYRDGYWANVGSWGYTWVDSAPWGYAPFHYGRWARIDGRWGWCPGAYVARPVWAPAMVGWIGGAGWGLSLNAGGPVYGWVPLGWGEAYLPWWKRCSHNCWTHYNRPYRVNVERRPSAPPPRYTYVGVPGAMTAVPAAAIAGRRPVSTNLVQVPASLATSAPVMATAPTVSPGPAPGPRVRPGADTTTGSTAPPPASTFVPPRRGGVAGEGEGSRPQTGTRPLPPTAVTPSTPAQPLPPAPTPPAARPGVTPTPTTVTPSAGQPAVTPPTGQPAATSPAQPALTPPAPRPSATPPVPPATAPAAPPFGATPPTPPATGGIGSGSPPQDGARWPAQSRRPPVFSAPPTVTSPPTGGPPTTGAPAPGTGGALPPPESQPRGQQRGPREPQALPPQTAPAPAAPASTAPPPVRALPPSAPPQGAIPAAPMPPQTRAVQPAVPPQSTTPAPMSPPTRAVQPSPPQGSGPLPAPPSRPAPPPVPVQGGGQGGVAAPGAPGPGAAPAPHGGGQGSRGGAGTEKGGEKGGRSADDKPAANPASGGGTPPK